MHNGLSMEKGIYEPLHLVCTTVLCAIIWVAPEHCEFLILFGLYDYISFSTMRKMKLSEPSILRRVFPDQYSCELLLLFLR